MKNIIITGAASGLGRALALEFAAQGADICVADINEQGSQETIEQIEKLGSKAWFFKLDVRFEAEWQKLLSAVIERWQRVDLVVNNAGVATGDRIDAGEWAWWEWIIDINLKGVALGCRTFTPMMKQQGSGQFLNVASLAGLLKLPSMASYNASKAGVIAISETMHFELMPYGIGTTVLCPSFFRTNLNASMKTSDPDMLKFVDKVFEASELNSQDIARIARLALEKNQLICNPHKDGRKAYFIKRFLPFLFNKQMLAMAKGLKSREPRVGRNSSFI